MAEMLRKQLLDTSRGRIVTLLQAGELTAEDIAGAVPARPVLEDLIRRLEQP